MTILMREISLQLIVNRISIRMCQKNNNLIFFPILSSRIKCFFFFFHITGFQISVVFLAFSKSLVLWGVSSAPHSQLWFNSDKLSFLMVSVGTWQSLCLHVQGPVEPLINSACVLRFNWLWPSCQMFGDVQAYAFPWRVREMIQSILGGKKWHL